MPSFTDMNCRHNNKKEWHASTLTLVIIFKLYTVYTLYGKKSRKYYPYRGSFAGFALELQFGMALGNNVFYDGKP